MNKHHIYLTLLGLYPEEQFTHWMYNLLDYLWDLYEEGNLCWDFIVKETPDQSYENWKKSVKEKLNPIITNWKTHVDNLLSDCD